MLNVLRLALAVFAMSLGAALAHPMRSLASDIDPATGDPTVSRAPGAASALSDVDAARAAEGIGPMTLPNGFDSLSLPLELMTVANLERVDRGLNPAVGLTATLLGEAQGGADARSDPIGPGGYAWGSNWAGGTQSSVMADFLWMYYDGPGSSNRDCSAAGQPGCWGHRHNILARWSDPLAVGAGSRGDSLTQLFVGGYGPAGPGGSDVAVRPLWSEIVQTLPVGVSPAAVALTHGATRGTLTVWASGEVMDVRASVSSHVGSWSVAPQECNLAPGTSCQMTLTASAAKTPSTGTLTLAGPNGPQSVPLARLIAQRLTARLASASVRRRQRDRVTGTVSPASTGQRVVLQLQRGRRWSTVARTTLRSGGRFALRLAASARGRRRYRVLKPAAGGYEQVTSRTLALRVT